MKSIDNSGIKSCHSVRYFSRIQAARVLTNMVGGCDGGWPLTRANNLLVPFVSSMCTTDDQAQA